MQADPARSVAQHRMNPTMSLTLAMMGRRDIAGARGAVGENAVDFGGVGTVRRMISRAMGSSVATATSASAFLKPREYARASCRLDQHAKRVLLADAGERRVDADQIFDLRARLVKPLPLLGGRLRVGFGVLDLLGNGVGIVRHVDARKVGRIGLRHLLSSRRAGS